MSHGEVRVATRELRGLAVDHPDLRRLLDHDNFSRAWADRTILKEDPNRGVALITGPAQECYLLKRLWPSTGKKWLDCVMSGALFTEPHRRLNWLHERQIAVPRSLAILRWRRDGEPESWCQLQEYLAEASTLHAALTDPEATSAERNLLIERATVQLANLHKLKRYHGDPKLTNLMVGDASVYLVDVGGRRSRRFGRAQQKDLARLLVGLAEAGMSKEQLAGAMAVYARCAGTLEDSFMAGVRAISRKIADRHAVRYGRSGLEILDL